MTIDSLLSYKYTAIIIEPRKHHALEFVLNNALYCLSSEWKIILFHGNDNVEYVNKIAERLNTERFSLNTFWCFKQTLCFLSAMQKKYMIF